MHLFINREMFLVCYFVLTKSTLYCIVFIFHLSKKCNYINTSLLKAVLIKTIMSVMKNILLHITTNLINIT